MPTHSKTANPNAQIAVTGIGKNVFHLLASGHAPASLAFILAALGEQPH